MYKKILVPLDGSQLAECVLPHVTDVAKSCQEPEIIFIQVVEPFIPAGAGEVMFTQAQLDEFNSARVDDARKYLDGVLKQMTANGQMKSEIIVGEPVHSLADFAEKNGVDIIIMATHGRSGISRWVWGSVADRLLRTVCVPTLMVRAPGCVPGFALNPEPTAQHAPKPMYRATV